MLHPMNPFVWLLVSVLDIYTWVVIAAVVVSWLVAFGVINLYNSFIRSVVRVLDALTEPVFRLVRRVIPPISGLDLAPLVVMLGIIFLRQSVLWIYDKVPF